jgi:2-polyprenyl-6-methoxyphenol hydroxylase-like FAD-dependent oxidoreductase
MEPITTSCCIAGGGPAGMMLALLLARAGVDVVVLEKHADFLRDFRGDTVHPSTLEVIYELGLLDEFLKLPHRRVERLGGIVGDTPVTIADFSHLPTRCKFIALMPQWDFLNFLAEHGRRYPSFHLHTRAEVTDLIEEGGRVVGVRATTPDGPLEVRATLVVGADGRTSVVRERAGLKVEDIGAPMDVLWMRLSRRDSDGAEALGRIAAGRMFVMIDRGDYWQCAYVIRKGAADEIKAQGLEAFREAIVGVAPLLRDRVQELKTWDDVKLLTVKIDRLARWHRPRAGTLSDDDLTAVQRRRTFPTRMTQRIQVFIQNNVLSRVLASRGTLSPPWPVRLLNRCPMLQGIPARLVGLGVRPEHVLVSPAIVPPPRA